MSGIANAEVAVPLGTFIPYSLRRNMAGGNNEIDDFTGAFIPFSIDGSVEDDRPSINDLYRNKIEYLHKVQYHLNHLVEEKLILPEDIHRILMRSSKYWNWVVSQPSKKNHKLKMMSFNIRYDNPRDGNSRWDNRKNIATQVIEESAADFIGIQEALKHQCNDIARGTKNYKWIGVGREDGKNEGEYAPIFYNRKEWKLINWNTFWLSESPDKPSRGWDAAFERIVTYGKFQHKESGLIIYVFNTHFDHRGTEARLNSAMLIQKKIKEIVSNHPFILTGDFNINPQTQAYRTLIQPTGEHPILDTKIMSLSEPIGPTGTFSGFQVDKILPMNQIDYIYCSDHFDVSKFETVVKSENGLYVSDHFPVTAELHCN